MSARIHAFKPHSEVGKLVSCSTDDPDATIFEVFYPGMPYSTSTLRFDDSYKTREVVWALDRAFEAGKKAAMKELRLFIGCNC